MWLLAGESASAAGLVVCCGWAARAGRSSRLGVLCDVHWSLGGLELVLRRAGLITVQRLRNQRAASLMGAALHTTCEPRSQSEQTACFALDGHESVAAERGDRVSGAVAVAATVATQQRGSAHTLCAITELAPSDLTVSLAV